MNANAMKRRLLVLLFAPLTALAATVGAPLDKAPDIQGDQERLQNGARLFVNYCLNCHGMSFVRYARLTELGISRQLVEHNLMFTADKIGETMHVAARPAEQKKWFGVMPPDLSLVARARASERGSGADWLYTYLRTFYRDPNKATGWNNLEFPDVAMPHVLWELQGEQVFDHEENRLRPGTAAGQLSAAEYDREVADLVGFLVWASEPSAGFRKQVGIGVLTFLFILLGISYALKQAFWKDVK